MNKTQIIILPFEGDVIMFGFNYGPINVIDRVFFRNFLT